MPIHARRHNAQPFYDSMTADSARATARRAARHQLRTTSSAGGLEKKDSQPSSVT